jgi:biotin-(acetyl-CoA carboxylase) ligase
LAFPATSIEETEGRLVDRAQLAADIVQAVELWSARVASDAFLRAWEEKLAYRGEMVRVDLAGEVIEGRLGGLGPDGEARLLLPGGGERLCGGEARWLRRAEG